ncbi:MAG: hypothetical protein IPQ07_39955 [Myxococcales bacterium]|nr:hypothetical protein [Myxococcales bacterium]
MESVEEFGREVHRAMHERALELANELSPVGDTMRAGRERLRGSWRDGAGKDAAIAAGKPSKVVSKAPHAGIIDRGAPSYAKGHKRRSASGTVANVATGRQIGSFRAPLGVRVVVLQRLVEEQDGIFSAVAERVFGSGGAA